MKKYHWSVAVLALAASLALAPATVASQATEKAQPGTTAAPPAERTEQPAPEQPAEPETVRFYRPLVRVGQNYTVRTGDVVSELQSVLGDVAIDGRVEEDAVVVLGSARLGGTAVINRSLVVVGGTATIAPGAAVHGDLVVVGGTLDAPPEFHADGTQVVIGTPGIGRGLRALAPWLMRGLLWGRLIVPDLQWVWVIVGVVFLVGLVLTLLFERPVRACAEVVATRPLGAFLLGLFVLLLTPPVLVILGATVVGLAIVPFVLCAVIAAGIIGKIGVSRAIGAGVLPESAPENRLLAVRSFVIGFVVLTLAYMVPLLGILTWAITGAVGLGAAAITFRVSLRKERPVPVPPPEVAVAPSGVAAAVVPVPPPPEMDPLTVDAARELPPAPPPPPGTAAVAYPRAAFLDRVAAFALDCILVAIAVQVLGLDRYDGAFLLWLFVYHVAFWAWRGTTMGGIVVGIRVVRSSGADLRAVDAVVRGLASIFSIAALGIGCLWMLHDPERQMWHDKIAGTFVVKVPREQLLS